MIFKKKRKWQHIEYNAFLIFIADDWSYEEIEEGKINAQNAENTIQLTIQGSQMTKKQYAGLHEVMEQAGKSYQKNGYEAAMAPIERSERMISQVFTQDEGGAIVIACVAYPHEGKFLILNLTFQANTYEVLKQYVEEMEYTLNNIEVMLA